MNTRSARLALGMIPILVTIVLVLSAGRAAAGQFPHARRGAVVGFDMGNATAGIGFERAGRDLEIDDIEGRTGALHVGYGFSDRFVLTLDFTGFDHESATRDVEFGAALVTASWYPGGQGFVLRLGLGGGHAEVDVDDPDAPVSFDRDGGAVALALGYEWRLGPEFALGLDLDLLGVGFEDFDGLEDVGVGRGGLAVRMSWYL